MKNKKKKRLETPSLLFQIWNGGDRNTHPHRCFGKLRHRRPTSWWIGLRKFFMKPSPSFMQWHHVELIHFALLRILHWAETDMDEEVTEPISVWVSSRHDQEHQGARLAKCWPSAWVLGRSQGWIIAKLSPEEMLWDRLRSIADCDERLVSTIRMKTWQNSFKLDKLWSHKTQKSRVYVHRRIS